MGERCDTLVIGGGPAGLFAAIHLHPGGNVVLLEKNPGLGKKLSIAGSGRCNITHDGPIENFLSTYGDHGRFLKTALMAFTNRDVMSFFHARGVDTIIDKNGKVFPKSDKATDIIDALIMECRKKGIRIRTGSSVTSVKKINEGFSVQTENAAYHARHLLIATGGKSYPATGSTGDGYRFAKALGHTLVEPRPALTPIDIRDYGFAGISGVSLTDRPIYLYRNGKKIREHTGDVLFTHKGISGPGILDFSRYFMNGDTLEINLVNLSPDTLRDALISANETRGKTSVKNYLCTCDCPESLVRTVLDEIHLDSGTTLACLSKPMRNRIITAFCSHSFPIGKIGGFHVAMATTGGVPLKEVNPKTMESRLVPGLYFAGEVLDIDGDTGGYNIQAAFSTGALAATAITMTS